MLRLLQPWVLLVLMLSACGTSMRKRQGAPAPNKQPLPQTEQVTPHVVSVDSLLSAGWKLPVQQHRGDEIPPAYGKSFATTNGKKYVSDYKFPHSKDLYWTAFVVVLWRAQDGSLALLTQKRSDGKGIEGQGGHLHDDMSWRQGAALELSQEAGISLHPTAFVYLQGGDLKENAHGNGYFGNVNFLVVLEQQKPKTTVSHESDPIYAHQWLDLRQVYNEVKKEQAQGWNKNGKYYSFFRHHVINLCEKVLNWH